MKPSHATIRRATVRSTFSSNLAEIDLKDFNPEVIGHVDLPYVFVAYRPCGCVRGVATKYGETYDFQRTGCEVIKLTEKEALDEVKRAGWWGKCPHQKTP